ncbi:hypothetical protein D8674_010544 [Pyrus ussuriensis x Pyrus communis]|uniref:Uncharacterized protein n=1 Tax=Pyrus ussuriensis x Pyrus communis TaxID=2448454 RepID=A0A5N5FBR0_9ROSA|nr:hypothetical protein D8674_010544 [Pyrus ussuriensis x Pyrus communis]
MVVPSRHVVPHPFNFTHSSFLRLPLTPSSTLFDLAPHDQAISFCSEAYDEPLGGIVGGCELTSGSMMGLQVS